MFVNFLALRPARLGWSLSAVLVVLLFWASAAAAAHRGAVLVKDINPGRDASITAIYSNCGCHYKGGDLTNVHGILYFSANDGRHGFELWRSDGTRKGTRMVKDINPGKGWSNIYGITAVGRSLYFQADDGVHGAELWRSDGTARGTRMVKDINPGAGPGNASQVTAFNGTLYFSAFGGLWRTDGTEAGTNLVKQIPNGAVPLINVSGTLFFGTFDGSRSELWRSDGTNAGTTRVKAGFFGTLEFTDLRGILYFSVFDTIRGPALWRSDGTEAGTSLVKAINPPPLSSIYSLTVVNNTLYFLASNASAIPSELWRSDGSEAGTILVKRVPKSFFELVPANGVLYLGGTGALWRSDGTPQGTKVIRGSPSSNAFTPSFLTPAKKTLYFVAADKKHSEELWRSNGARKGTAMVKDIHRGQGGSDPRNLTAVGKSLFFTARGGGQRGRELWRAGPRLRMTGKKK